MKFSRSLFLKQTATATAAFLLPQLADAHTPTPSPDISLDKIGDLFTINPEIIFLNNGTMGPSPKPVVDAMIEGLDEITKKALYGRRKPEATDTLAGFINCTSNELALTHSTTEGINMMAQGIALKAGDEIIMTSAEHVGNAAPWVNRAKQDKLIIKAFKLAPTFAETFANLKKIVTAKTKVIAIPHIPCTNGQVLPIKEIAQWARTKNILTCIDGAHGIGMLPLDLQELNVDFYAGCCHKWLLAAQGTGFLYVNKNSNTKIKQTFLGAEGIVNFFTANNTVTVQDTPINGHGFMFGTQSGALLNSITAAAQLQNNLGKENIKKLVLQLAQYTYDGVKDLGKGVTIVSPAEAKSRSGMTSFTLKGGGSAAKKLYEHLASKNIIVRYVPENDIHCIRVSTHIYNTKAQIDEMLKEIKSQL
jgi:selenocysteine lyase/cysteine desulfurase